MSLATRFNRSRLGRFLNSAPGRVFRLVGGTGFVVLGVILVRADAVVPGAAAVAWGALAIVAGGFDVCFFSLVLGGPLAGAACRADAGGAPRRA